MGSLRVHREKYRLGETFVKGHSLKKIKLRLRLRSAKESAVSLSDAEFAEDLPQKVFGIQLTNNFTNRVERSAQLD